jgi:hypothetical protein
MIARAEELHSLTIRARYEVGRFEALDFPDKKFDRVFSMEALYHAVDLPTWTIQSGGWLASSTFWSKLCIWSSASW